MNKNLKQVKIPITITVDVVGGVATVPLHIYQLIDDAIRVKEDKSYTVSSLEKKYGITIVAGE